MTPVPDLVRGAGAAATMMAAARAVATADRLIDDRFAAPLVRAVGADFAARVADGELDLSELGDDAGFPRLAELFAARTRFFDRFLVDAAGTGITQAVILGSGLDTRAYRLWWPAGITVYEIDRPGMVEFKTAAMRALDAVPHVSRRAVGIDLRRDWPAALRRVGFDTDAPTAWVAEGLLIGTLPPDTQDRLLDSVTEMSATGSRFAADHPAPASATQAAQAQALSERWRKRGLEVDIAGLTYPGERNDVSRYLAARGWATTDYGITELFATTRMPQLSAHDLDGVPAAIGYLTAIRR